MATKKKPTGRPPSGPGGTRVGDLPKATFYVTPETKARLKAASILQGEAEWRLVDEAVQSHINALPPKQRKEVDRLARQLAAQ